MNWKIEIDRKYKIVEDEATDGICWIYNWGNVKTGTTGKGYICKTREKCINKIKEDVDKMIKTKKKELADLEKLKKRYI